MGIGLALRRTSDARGRCDPDVSLSLSFSTTFQPPMYLISTRCCVLVQAGVAERQGTVVRVDAVGC